MNKQLRSSWVCAILLLTIVCSFQLKHKTRSSHLKFHSLFATNENIIDGRVDKSGHRSFDASNNSNSRFLHGASKILSRNLLNLIAPSPFNSSSPHIINHSSSSLVEETVTKQSQLQLQIHLRSNSTNQDVHSPAESNHSSLWQRFQRYISVLPLIKSNVDTSTSSDNLYRNSSTSLLFASRDLHHKSIYLNTSNSSSDGNAKLDIDIGKRAETFTPLLSSASISTNTTIANAEKRKPRNGNETFTDSWFLTLHSIFKSKQSSITNNTDTSENSFSNKSMSINQTATSQDTFIKTKNITSTPLQLDHVHNTSNTVDLTVFEMFLNFIPTILSSKQSTRIKIALDDTDQSENQDNLDELNRQQELTAVEQTIMEQVSLTLGHREGFLPPDTITDASEQKRNQSKTLPIWQWLSTDAHLSKEFINKLEEEEEEEGNDSSEDNIAIAEENDSTDTEDTGSHLFEMKQNLMPIEANSQHIISNDDDAFDEKSISSSNETTNKEVKPTFTDGIVHLLRRSLFPKWRMHDERAATSDNTVELLSYLSSLSTNDSWNERLRAVNMSMFSSFPGKNASKDELHVWTLTPRQEFALAAALAVKTEKDTVEFLQKIGLEPLYSILFHPLDHNQTLSNDPLDPHLTQQLQLQTDAIRALFTLTRHYKPLADELGQQPALINVFCDLLEAPGHISARHIQDTAQSKVSLMWHALRSFFNKNSSALVQLEQEAAKAKLSDLQVAAHRAQHETVALVQWLVRCSEVAVGHLRHSQRLRSALFSIMTCDTHPVCPNDDHCSSQMTANITDNSERSGGKDSKHSGVNAMDLIHNNAIVYLPSIDDNNNNFNISSSSHRKQQQQLMLKKRNATVLVDYSAHLKPFQMARVAHWGLGGVPWQRKRHVPGHRGVRILSFDGGGTRGVVSIACLKELFARVAVASSGGDTGSAAVSRASLCRPSDYFDLICGTSTGGIIAMLLGGQCRSIGDTETLYDEFIDKIFATKSNFKLVREQAAYDETQFERILHRLCGESLLLDTNQQACTRVFCVSTRINTYPPVAHLWRNYNYPVVSRDTATTTSSRYPGTFRVNAMTAVRATTAAPTFFTPVSWHGDLFSDGALVANNPTAIALQEAKRLFPETPIECVVSIGTGSFFAHRTHMQTLGWDTLVNQLIASSTDTEDTHHLLQTFLPATQYFRFNPVFPEDVPIDVKDKSVLSALKRVAKTHYEALEQSDEGHRYQQLVDLLSGTTQSQSQTLSPAT